MGHVFLGPGSVVDKTRLKCGLKVFVEENLLRGPVYECVETLGERVVEHDESNLGIQSAVLEGQARPRCKRGLHLREQPSGERLERGLVGIAAGVVAAPSCGAGNVGVAQCIRFGRRALGPKRVLAKKPGEGLRLTSTRGAQKRHAAFRESDGASERYCISSITA